MLVALSHIFFPVPVCYCSFYSYLTIVISLLVGRSPNIQNENLHRCREESCILHHSNLQVGISKSLKAISTHYKWILSMSCSYTISIYNVFCILSVYFLQIGILKPWPSKGEYVWPLSSSRFPRGVRWLRHNLYAKFKLAPKCHRPVNSLTPVFFFLNTPIFAYAKNRSAISVVCLLSCTT